MISSLPVRGVGEEAGLAEAGVGSSSSCTPFPWTVGLIGSFIYLGTWSTSTHPLALAGRRCALIVARSHHCLYPTIPYGGTHHARTLSLNEEGPTGSPEGLRYRVVEEARGIYCR